MPSAVTAASWPVEGVPGGTAAPGGAPWGHSMGTSWLGFCTRSGELTFISYEEVASRAHTDNAVDVIV